jgi:hypothetical protein
MLESHYTTQRFRCTRLRRTAIDSDPNPEDRINDRGTKLKNKKDVRDGGR